MLGLPLGSKINIRIPKPIFKNDEFAKRCIIGIIDTDFNLNDCINFNGILTSLRVIKQISSILKRLKLNHSCNINQRLGRIYIKKSASTRILEEWNIHNQKHYSKYLLWKEFHKYLPFTHTEERLAVLKGKLDIEELALISKKRRANT